MKGGNMDKTNWSTWTLLAMWGVYALCFVPFLPTSITHVALFFLAVLGTVAALACIVRRRFYSRTFLTLGLLYMTVFLTSVFTAKYLSGSAESSAEPVGKFLKGAVMLIRARIDSGDLWPAFTIAYTQLVMPVLVVVLVIGTVVDIMDRTPRVSVR